MQKQISGIAMFVVLEKHAQSCNKKMQKVVQQVANWKQMTQTFAKTKKIYAQKTSEKQNVFC